MDESLIFLDGAYVCVPRETLAAFTPGRALGEGVFETMRVVHGRIEFLKEHVTRLLDGLNVLGIDHKYTHKRLCVIARRVALEHPKDGIGRLRLMIFKKVVLHCAAMVLPYSPPSKTQYRRGLKAVIVPSVRPATAQHARVKSLDYCAFSAAYNQARQAGMDEALLTNARGHVFEASRANIFIALNGRLVTPPLSSGCLDGIMRRQVFLIAARMGLAVYEQDLTPAMVRSADHIFLTNSLMGIIPCFI